MINFYKIAISNFCGTDYSIVIADNEDGVREYAESEAKSYNAYNFSFEKLNIENTNDLPKDKKVVIL